MEKTDIRTLDANPCCRKKSPDASRLRNGSFAQAKVYGLEKSSQALCKQFNQFHFKICVPVTMLQVCAVAVLLQSGLLAVRKSQPIHSGLILTYCSISRSDLPAWVWAIQRSSAIIATRFSCLWRRIIFARFTTRLARRQRTE